jgi:hypothetical protein
MVLHFDNHFLRKQVTKPDFRNLPFGLPIFYESYLNEYECYNYLNYFDLNLHWKDYLAIKHHIHTVVFFRTVTER